MDSILLIGLLGLGTGPATGAMCAEIEVPREEIVRGEVGVRLNQFLSGMTDKGFSGAVLVSRETDILLKKGYGLAKRQEWVDNTSETLFNVASVAKTFTAAAILNLEVRGKLNVQDRVSSFVGALPGAKSGATVHHLLTHTAGLAIRGTPLDYESRDAFLESLKRAPIESIPGEVYRYTNAGYTLLAAIVETVSGLPFESFLKERIFEPACMATTAFVWDGDLREHPVAVGYRGERVEELVPAPPEEDQWGNRGPGSIATTVGDLYRWTRAIKGGVILPRGSIERMFSAYVGDEGYGWHVLETEHGRLVRRGGGLPEFESSLRWYVDEDVVIALAINNHIGLRVPIAEGIERIVFGVDRESR